MHVRKCMSSETVPLSWEQVYPHTHAHTSRAPYVAGNLASLQIVQILSDSQLWRKCQVNVCVASSEKECCTAWNCLPSTMHKDGESLFTRQKLVRLKFGLHKVRSRAAYLLTLDHGTVGSVYVLRRIGRVQLYNEVLEGRKVGSP